ncbi:hypothetical protein PHYBLDRAFT_169763 [Phycomyces blakesleeanus NRRL 1555(-)]|uniref:Uncharacterized protein n=1 Tax=Phycomyces blakesleeanus (strain ATCC 8743b / DSM 1359 / FGSC 10004 / NBRC 33097 / NRRL 1555) TaxID=763407 RepID=A0A163AD13_PHYB8|nr:hypothetical protein PHYBLDRAFT_169763 [Phycomyces blakesleeanus NRRL 1555(-)]OAD72641.1 hypothetical protein PHYBLDRAFT_169763 [Phycomyces blakesleeanus NRRL 1555(-)]|eukprot:XP_018290681.1 hypothetical protein PHYBLDRAFT_169763 [Phycomyces blakesleeanus NRRL 1555(-)]
MICTTAYFHDKLRGYLTLGITYTKLQSTCGVHYNTLGCIMINLTHGYFNQDYYTQKDHKGTSSIRFPETATYSILFLREDKPFQFKEDEESNDENEADIVGVIVFKDTMDSDNNDTYHNICLFVIPYLKMDGIPQVTQLMARFGVVFQASYLFQAGAIFNTEIIPALSCYL